MSIKEKVQVDHCIIGGGIVGLFVALELVQNYPDQTICLLEKSAYFGDETTGRNSGVLHAGIYYETNSLKHRLCLEGKKLWLELKEKHGFPVHQCGKYIISTSKNEDEKLAAVFEKAKANQVDGMRFSTNQENKDLEQFLNVSSSIFSSSTGIIDIPVAVKMLSDELEKRGVLLMKHHHVTNIEHDNEFTIEFDDFLLETKNLYNHAGLESLKIRSFLGLNNLEHKLVKGNYVKTSQKLEYKNLFYPIPESNLKGLGVHSTLDFNGDIKFGPNTEDIDEVNYKLNPVNLETMTVEIQKVFKGIDTHKLYLDYCGIRTKIIDPASKELIYDFWVQGPKDHGIANYYETCGIESPGVTSAPAIAKYVLNRK